MVHRWRLEICAVSLSTIHQEYHWCHPHNQCGINFSTGCHVAKIEHSSFLPDSDEFITRTIGRFALRQHFLLVRQIHILALLTESFMVVVHGSIFWLANRPVSTWCIHIFAISHCDRPKESIPVGLKFAKLQIHSSEVALPSSVGTKDLLQPLKLNMLKRKWMSIERLCSLNISRNPVSSV